MYLIDRPGALRVDQLMNEYETLARKRVLFCYGEMVPSYAAQVTQPVDVMLLLDSQSNDPIKMVIESPGGMVSTGFVLCDTMRSINSPVWTIGRTCCSMAAILLAAGEPGHRYLYPHSRVMLHLPFGQMAGDTTDMKIQAAEMNKLKEQIVDLLIDCGVKRTRKQILKDIDRDFWMNAEEAIEYGLADKIVTENILY